MRAAPSMKRGSANAREMRGPWSDKPRRMADTFSLAEAWGRERQGRE